MPVLAQLRWDSGFFGQGFISILMTPDKIGVCKAILPPCMSEPYQSRPLFLNGWLKEWGIVEQPG
jgi:hypothetical protein